MAALSLALAVVSLLAGVASGLGYRLGLWELGTGFGVLRWATIGALGSIALSLAGLYATRSGIRRGRVSALAALLLGIGVASPPLWWLWTARQVPPIHDITTDTEDPPVFAAALPLRAGAPNPAEYGGPEVAARQREAYPDIAPLHARIPPDRAFAVALATARERGWDIIAAESAAGRIEASDTTSWFGFIDDVVIRIALLPEGGSRVDVRSVSRVGRSDVGTNARRIRAFLSALEEKLGERGN